VYAVVNDLDFDRLGDFSNFLVRHKRSPLSPHAALSKVNDCLSGPSVAETTPVISEGSRPNDMRFVGIGAA
jgi:hypothetical protein